MSLELWFRHTYPGGFQLDIDFRSDQPITVLLGPSGSGKTSILRALAGFLRPAEGRIELAGQVVVDTERRIFVPPEKRRVGMVFQDHLLFPHMSVAGNLRYGRRHRRRARRTVETKRVVEVLEIGSLLERYPRNLSGGEMQRVALARALVSGPEILLMDEPLASLDAPLKAKILSYLQQIVSEWRIPVLYVTHSQGEVRRLADEVVVLDAGRVVGGGPPDEALSRPEPLGWKNGVGPVNLLRVEKLRISGGEALGRVGDQDLHVPRQQCGEQTTAYVQFLPRDVTLTVAEVHGLSARNRLQGRIRQLVPLQSAVFVAVDVGQLLWAEVTPQAVEELQLAPNAEVTCLVKVQSLQVIG